jgi:hypothetical protein
MSWLAELPASENPPIDEFTKKQADSAQLENKYELKRIKNKLYREKKKKQKEDLKKEEANAGIIYNNINIYIYIYIYILLFNFHSSIIIIRSSCINRNFIIN